MEKKTMPNITETRNKVLYAIFQSIPLKLKLNLITIAHQSAMATEMMSNRKIIDLGTMFIDLSMLVFGVLGI
jgi:hypothetical protein